MGYFLLGVCENVTLYSLTVVLRGIYYSAGGNASSDQRLSCFLLFIVMVFFYILFDCCTPWEKWKWLRQLFRIGGIALAVIGAILRDQIFGTAMACLIALLSLVYLGSNTLTVWRPEP
jgi:hypothetical protein